MESGEATPARRRPHLLDLLALAAALAASVALYAVLFRRTAPPRPVDPLLGTVIEVDAAADYPWKREFPRAGEQVMLDDLLAADVLEAGDAPDRPATRRIRLRIRDRQGQDPAAILNFRWGISRGSRVSVSGSGADGRPVSTLPCEVVTVTPPGAR